MATFNAIDPVDYAVISQALIAAAREMGVKLIQSAYSTIIREAADASAALFDHEGNIVAQAELIPMHLGPMSEIFRYCVKYCPIVDLREGDFYITNDPYSGGQHLQDVFIYTPVFFEGEIIAFAGTVAHHLDLGGGNPGLTTEAVDVHAEGIIIPPSRYNFERDWKHGPLQRLIAANIRVPVQTIGDFNAQFAASATGSDRVSQLCEKFGAAKVTATMAQLVGYSEQRFKAALQAIPDGVYYGEDFIDDDGIDDQPLPIRAKVTVRDSMIAIDYAGTAPQVRRNLNCPFASTISASLSAVKAALTDPDIPFNEGVKRPVSITAPVGTLVNPSYPAPVRARMEVAYRCFNAVLKALSRVVPERVIAGGNDTTHVISLSHLNENQYQVYLEVYGGGYGASAHGDGCSGVDSPLSNCTNTPVEATDMDFDHFRIIGYGLIKDSCGHGRQRGGLGLYRRFEILRDEINFAIYADRFRIAPYGLFGGSDGNKAYCEIERNGEVIHIKSKDNLILHKGDILTLYTAGGGGYGEVADRNKEKIASDIRQGFISEDTARKIYFC